MRDMNKALQDYQNKFLGTNKGQFRVSDIMQVAQLSIDDDKFSYITNGLMCGFMIGYRFAKNEKKK